MNFPPRATPMLLAAHDPAPVERLRGGRSAPIVLACEHGGRAIPQGLVGKAPSQRDMARHIAYDIGAEMVARRLAKNLALPLVIQRYSRLVIDCNRPRSAPDLTPGLADATLVGFNQGLDADSTNQRWRAIHQPFHDALARTLDQHAAAALVTIHSFTPRLNGFDRPWHIGFLARRDMRLAGSLTDYFSRAHPGIVTAINQPYRIEDNSDYTIPVHAEPHKLVHVLVEIRNTLIGDTRNAARSEERRVGKECRSRWSPYH